MKASIRKPSEPLAVVLLKIDSLYSALYGMYYSQKEVSELILRQKLFLVGAFVSPLALKLLIAYARERARRGRSLKLEKIVR